MGRSEAVRLVVAVLLVLAADGAAARARAQDETKIEDCTSSSGQVTDRVTGKRVPALGCGPSSSDLVKAKTTGGVAAPDERFTAAIFFNDQDGNEGICTGVLLDTQHVLTAGHCGCGQVGSYRVSFSQSPRLGDEKAKRVQILGAPILFDPMACIRGIAPGKDLALLRLEKSMLEPPPGAKDPKLSPRDHGYPFFAPTLDSRKALTPPAPLTVVGYGLTETGDIATRMKASVPILTATCLGAPYKDYCAQFQEMILADRSGAGVPRDTCEGDSGGPVYAKLEVRMPPCDGGLFPPGAEYENVPSQQWITVTQNVLVAITSRAAPFTQPLAGGHCGGGSVNTLIWRKSVFAWFDANHVRPQKCVVKPKPN